MLVILFLPLFPSFGSGTSVRIFQAAAQTTSLSSTSRIFQNCLGPICADLFQLENDAVNTYLALHELPATDAQIIYNYGRADLRNDVRGIIFALLLAIIAKPASQRTPHEQNLYLWLQSRVQENEIAEYTLAINQYDYWRTDPCLFKLDSDIATQYKLEYDGEPFCYKSFGTIIFGQPPVPAKDYFVAYGLKNSYGKTASEFPTFSSMVVNTDITAAEVVRIASTGAGWVIAAAGGTLVGYITVMLAAGGASLIYSMPIFYFGSGFHLGVSVTAGIVAGAAAIVLLAIIIGVQAGLQAFNNQKQLNDLNNLSKTLNQVRTTPPDLAAFVTDSSGVGMYKVEATIVAQTVPDVPSAATLPTHSSSDLNFAILKPTSHGISSTLAYRDWNGENWSAQTYGGWFVQTCTSSSGCPRANSISASLRYVDWLGADWTAWRIADKFISIKANPASSDISCPPIPTTGLSPESDFSNCKTAVSTTLHLQDPNGVLEEVSLSVLAPPVFKAPTTLPFTPGVPSSQTITASGNPTPQICFSSSTPALPSSFTLNGTPLSLKACATGVFNLSFNGAKLPQQIYQLGLAASNGTGPKHVTQNFAVDVSPHLGITSPAILTGAADTPVNFLVTTTGIPPITLSADPGVLVPGLTFKDNGNGTASISGASPVPAIQHQCLIYNGGPCGIHATNSQGTLVQSFIVNLAPAPIASLGPPSSATFITGAPNSVLLTSVGAITPVSWFFDTRTAPAWLHLTDNGNGTATLSGTPPLGTSGTFLATISPISRGSGGFINGNPYHVNVENVPVFLSSDTATFTVGNRSSFTVLANQGTIGLVDTLPAALSFLLPSLQCFIVNANGACIAGIPDPGTGGQHDLTLTADAGSIGVATQSLTININEGPQITSPNSATLIAGSPGSFAVTTTGFPNLSTAPVPAKYAPPTSPNEGKGMYFTVTGLPADLSFSNLNPEGLATGTLTIQGTPSAADAGLHRVEITADNGVGSKTQQILALTVIAFTGSVPASSNTCDGAYFGTFNGNVSAFPGQNCIFAGGGTTGNVTVNGGNVLFIDGAGVAGSILVNSGHLALSQATISGDVTIRGTSGFSIDTGTTLGGNLIITNASDSSISQLCGTEVAGDVDVLNNAAPIELGSPSPSCPGNSLGGNVLVRFNTAATSIYNNLVAGTLDCSDNTSIEGGGNSAGQQKQGQCVQF